MKGLTETIRRLCAERNRLMAENEQIDTHRRKVIGENENLLNAWIAKDAENKALRAILEEFPGFTDDASIGDPWIERKDAALSQEPAK